MCERGKTSPENITMIYHTFCDKICIYLPKLVVSNFRPHLEIFYIKTKIISFLLLTTKIYISLHA
jgi:hypothetical protein